MLPDSKIQEWLSEGCFKTTTTMAGLNIARDDGDFGFDGYLSEPWGKDGSIFPGTSFIGVQLKSVVGARVDHSHVTYRLKLRAYDILRDPSFSFPALLILFVLPTSDQSKWVTWQENATSISGATYWFNLRGLPERKSTTNYANAKVTIKIPRDQQFNAESAKKLWELCKQGNSIPGHRSAK